MEWLGCSGIGYIVESVDFTVNLKILTSHSKDKLYSGHFPLQINIFKF